MTYQFQLKQNCCVVAYSCCVCIYSSVRWCVFLPVRGLHETSGGHRSVHKATKYNKTSFIKPPIYQFSCFVPPPPQHLGDNVKMHLIVKYEKKNIKANIQHSKFIICTTIMHIYVQVFSIFFPFYNKWTSLYTGNVLNEKLMRRCLLLYIGPLILIKCLYTYQSSCIVANFCWPF